jgi:protein-S-isoprenylcysteine O-methyltransferase Ste14
MPESVASGAAFRIAFLIGLGVGVAIRLYYSRRSRHPRPRSSDLYWPEWPLLILSWVGMQVFPIVFVFTSWLSFADYRLPAWAGVAGAAVFALALFLLWRSHADLGRNWAPVVVIHEEQTLVTTGVYARVRHPMYAAHLLWALAQPLMLWNWIAGPAFLVAFVPLYVLRVSREERVMIERFGNEYRTYTIRTGRIIPRFGRASR